MNCLLKTAFCLRTVAVLAVASWSGATVSAGEPDLQAVGAEMAAAEVAVGKVLFNRKCARCHTAEEAENDVGPSLYRVVGRPAGTFPGYDYSSSIRDSGLVWDEENLRKYINDPHAFVPCKKIQIKALSMCPGIHMKFHGFRNPYAAKAVVAYLKSHGTVAVRGK